MAVTRLGVGVRGGGAGDLFVTARRFRTGVAGASGFLNRSLSLFAFFTAGLVVLTFFAVVVSLGAVSADRFFCSDATGDAGAMRVLALLDLVERRRDMLTNMVLYLDTFISKLQSFSHCG